MKEFDHTDEQANSADRTRVFLEVVTTFGWAVEVVIRIRLEIVEVWCRDRCCAIFDRDELRSWLSSGRRPLAVDDVAFSLDPRWDSERIAISLPDVIAWTISPTELAAFRERV